MLLYHDCMYWFLNDSWETIHNLKSEFEFIFCGILTAGGDTKYPMYLEIAAAWCGAALPTILMSYFGCLNSVKEVYTLIPISCFINCFLIYKRYSSLSWFNKLV